MKPESFGGNEVNLLSQIVREAYSDTLATDTWTRVLDMIGGLVPYDFAGAAFANVQSGRLENRITSRLDAELLRWYDEHYGAIEMIASVAQARGLTLWRPSGVIGTLELEASDLGKNLLKGHGLREPICMTCGSATELSARFWFLREACKDDFSERDLFVLGLLQPHFCTALRLAKDHLECSVYRESFRLAKRPGALCDSSGKITKMNESAQRLGSDGDGRDNGVFAQLDAAAQDMVRRGISLITADLGSRKCRLSITPVTSAHAPTSHLLFIDTEADLHRILHRLMVDSDLSEREAEVCMMLVQGASNREIADKLFIAECTVKDHVTAIFDKLGVVHRSAVVPKLLGI
jgi:DNA-binding CsgD family transcriptional regulator